MTDECFDCGGSIKIPKDYIPGEIVSCQDCGLDYVIVKSDNKLLSLQELTIEGEDWGE